MPLAILPDRAVLRLGGEEAAPWLNNLVTSEVAGLAPGAARFAALLSPQGKILADFFVHRQGDALLLDLPAALAPDIARRLSLYRLRARIAIEPVPARVAALWGEIEDAPAGAVPDPRLAALGARAVVRDGIDADAGPDDYLAHRVALGVPEGGLDFRYAETFPHEADMDQLGGVDFRKGCYVGQEVVSRMQHRGTARTRVVPLRVESPLPPPGVEVRAGDRPLGALGSRVGGRALALLRLDRVQDAIAAGEPLRAGDAVVTVERPDWWSAAWPLTAAETLPG